MNWQEYLGNLEWVSKGTGKNRNGGELLNKRYIDKAMLLLPPTSLNKSLKLKKGSNLPI